MRKGALFLFGLVVMALVALGLTVLSSASEANGMRLHNDAFFFMKRQFSYLAVGILVAVIVALFDYRHWRNHWSLAVAFYLGVAVLLCLVFMFPPINGSRRWLPFGFLRLQPSEFAKLAVVIATAVWMDLSGWRVELFWRGAIAPMAVIGLFCALVLLEPDFGSVMVIGLAGILVMFLAGTRIMHLLPIGLTGLVAVCAVLVTNENRMRRLGPFFAKISAAFGGGESAAAAAAVSSDISSMDPASYQAYMARVAIQNGGMWGMGLGESMQKHLYLPEAHTDFIFAVGAEELGIMFSIAVVLLFLAFFAISVYIARKACDRFGRYLVMGMSFIVFFQAMFNLGVVCEALPTKGMALPFFSYGGTNLMATFFAVGTILSVGIHSASDAKRARPFMGGR